MWTNVKNVEKNEFWQVDVDPREEREREELREKLPLSPSMEGVGRRNNF